MIGSINGPDAPAAVAWLEADIAEYLEACAALDRIRLQAVREHQDWYQRGAMLSGDPKPPSAVRRWAESPDYERQAAAIRRRSPDATMRPMFELIHDDEGDAWDAAARWPERFDELEQVSLDE